MLLGAKPFPSWVSQNSEHYIFDVPTHHHIPSSYFLSIPTPAVYIKKYSRQVKEEGDHDVVRYGWEEARLLHRYHMFCFQILSRFVLKRGAGTRGEYSPKCKVCSQRVATVEIIFCPSS